MTANQAARAKGWHDGRYRELVERLLAKRKEMGLTQSDLATRLGRRQHFVSRFETGERRLDVAKFSDIALELGLNPSDLIRELWTA